MPNHVINEVIFRNISAERRRELLTACCTDNDKVDFERLLPTPLNSWQGGVSEKHEKTFPHNDLDWCRSNWGTKWNAYSHRPIERGEDYLILRFESAWRPPYGWLVAVFNRFKINFDHNWLSEGTTSGVSGEWRWVESEIDQCRWDEVTANDEMQRHLNTLLWGKEDPFSDDC